MDSTSLHGKTLFVTGASRGIGLAIAKRAAADGANVAIVAKTAEPHPKLPGTIYTAAEEIEARRRPGAARSPADIRSDEQVRAAVGADGRALRRHRRPGQQRLGDLAHRHARDADEALRPDVRRSTSAAPSSARRPASRTC